MVVASSIASPVFCLIQEKSYSRCDPRIFPSICGESTGWGFTNLRELVVTFHKEPATSRIALFGRGHLGGTSNPDPIAETVWKKWKHVGKTKSLQLVLSPCAEIRTTCFEIGWKRWLFDYINWLVSFLLYKNFPSESSHHVVQSLISVCAAHHQCHVLIGDLAEYPATNSYKFHFFPQAAGIGRLFFPLLGCWVVGVAKLRATWISFKMPNQLYSQLPNHWWIDAGFYILIGIGVGVWVVCLIVWVSHFFIATGQARVNRVESHSRIRSFLVCPDFLPYPTSQMFSSHKRCMLRTFNSENFRVFLLAV